MTEQEKLEHVAGDNPEATVGDGVSFIKVRRITGYLVGDVRKRFNNAKQAEVRDRVKHFSTSPDAQSNSPDGNVKKWKLPTELLKEAVNG